MRAAADIQDEATGWIGRDDGRITDTPKRKGMQQFVGEFRLVVQYFEQGELDPGVGHHHAEGATRDDRRRRVPLGALAPSQPYVYSPLTVVLSPKAAGRRIAGIGDLAGLRLAIESGTLADAILMTFDKGRLIDDITHLVPGRDDLLGALDRGDSDATLLDLRRFDAYRLAHPDSRIAPSGYFYPIGANRGYVGLASDPDLLAAVNKALSDLQAAGTIAELAKTAGLSYLAPREPIILGDVWQTVLQKQQ